MALSSAVHRALAALSRLTRGPERIIIAFHASPSADALARTLDILDDVAGPFVSVRDLVNGAQGCALTFDDGDRSIIDVAAPVLVDRGIPASAYVVAGFVGTTQPFWWTEVEARAGADAHGLIRRMKEVPDDERLQLLQQLRARTAGQVVEQANLEPRELPELEAAGITVGNHSFTHPLLDRCPGEKVVAELSDAHTRLTDLLGHAPTEIAYPNGNTDDRAARVARDLGYDIGLLFDHATVGEFIADPLRISRVRLDVGSSAEVIRSHASGLHPKLHATLGRS